MKALIVYFILCIPFLLMAQERKTEKVLSDYGVIWGFDFIDEENILLTEREGSLYRVNLKNKQRTKIQGVPTVLNKGQGGLLDIKLHPDFKKNNWIYFTYSHADKDKNTTRLARAKLNKNTLDKFEILFTAEPFSDNTIHFGSRIVFDGQGHVFFSVGDRNERKKAQDLKTHNGKILRLTEDGKVPQDNPFAKDKNKKTEIWSYGHRNPQGIFYDFETKELWSSEHGPRGGDEINLILKGRNYGWPVITYGREYWGPKIGEESKEGMEQPIKMYKPSIASGTLFIYKGDKYPGWKNSFFQGALALNHLNRVEIKNHKAVNEERLFSNQFGRIRHVHASPAGYIYFSTDSGELYKIL